ncbi:hypothetical protein VC83_02118 [Pseudogymnoascus destructans]|uniref:Uncharacterized protein n=1 Tax=Pseudogymnoascus destructans TaxID=655981 RepID=A0A177AI69_9PEZI|nr:uncharacterized protein VC83_02118 [Pseudogymnoascus destructans]OAF61490.1 hypothetical protein VC83_02118 [Pseudogymnoascus destructans]
MHKPELSDPLSLPGTAAGGPLNMTEWTGRGLVLVGPGPASTGLQGTIGHPPGAVAAVAPCQTMRTVRCNKKTTGADYAVVVGKLESSHADAGGGVNGDGGEA